MLKSGGLRFVLTCAAVLGAIILVVYLIFVLQVVVMDHFEPGAGMHAYHWCLLNHRGQMDAFIQDACRKSYLRP